jgi:hypothetical protein
MKLKPPSGGPGRVVIAGALTQRSEYGGHVWALLQYVLGYARLGWDVLFIDHLDPDMCLERSGRRCRPERSQAAKNFAQVMDDFGLLDRAALLVGGRTVVGVPKRTLVERTRDATFLLNVMGYLDDDDLLGAAPRRVFLDIDPGFGQMWRELGLADIFSGHDAFVTVGENIQDPGSGIPDCGLDWITTVPPVVLDLWPLSHKTRDVFTTVGTWRGPYGPVQYKGRTYGLRVHEFRRFAELPRRAGWSLEAALDIDPADVLDHEALRTGGWNIVDPLLVAGGAGRYRHYIQDSMGEVMVAKNMYVQTQGGWLSDRSVCYLASGKPVVAQDTGWTRNHPDGEGLLSFTTPEEAAAAINEVGSDYDRHAAAARALAEEEFASSAVLERLAARVCEANVGVRA